MSTFWSLWIIVLTLTNIALLIWVLLANRKVAIKDDEDPENRTTGHVYDGIEEFDNPLPKWWFQLFILTIIYGAIYLAVYPGLGSFKGFMGWTSVNQLEAAQQKAEEKYSETFGAFAAMSIEDVAEEPKAMKMGLRLFSNNCAVCHGSDAGGNYGFPNLTDKDWLYGGTPEQIKASITHGRNGQMPAWGAIIGEENVVSVSEQVMALSGQDHDATLAAKGAEVYAQNCSACHGANGEGVQAMGAPALADDTWLYEGTREGIRHSIRNGRSGVMPAQTEKLKADKIHLLSAYVYSLSLYDDE